MPIVVNFQISFLKLTILCDAKNSFFGKQVPFRVAKPNGNMLLETERLKFVAALLVLNFALSLSFVSFLTFFPLQKAFGLEL